MNWIEAYINSVKMNLPRASREDIGSELQGLLEESIEAETGKTSKDLSDEESIAWLKTREHPALLATRYQERRALIDEDSFPLFKLTLRYVFIGLIVAYIVLAFLNAFRYDGYHYFSFTRLGGDILHAGLLAFAVTAVVFHFFGKHLNAKERLANWNPRDLPSPASSWEHEPYSSSIAGLVFSGIFLLFLNGFLTGIVAGSNGSGASPFEAPIAEEAASLLPWINVVLIGSILLHGFMILKPYWSTTTLAINGLLALGAAIILYQLQGISPMFEPAVSGPSEEEGAAQLLIWGNTTLRITLLIMLAATIYECARDLWRIVKLGNRRPV